MAPFGRLASVRWLRTLCALVFTSGCAGSGGAPAIPNAFAVRQAGTAPLALAPGVKHVFLSDAVLNIVTIFDRNGKTRRLTGFSEPQGITTNRAGDLYVADTVAAEVEVFNPPYRNKPNTIITDHGLSPSAVAVAKDGTVALIGCQGTGSQCREPDRVDFFANARFKRPCAMVTGDPTLAVLIYGAFDAHGNLYVAGLDNVYTTSRLGVINGECNATKLQVLRATAKIHFAAGVQIDAQGNVATVDSGGFSRGTTIDVFAPPKHGSARLNLISQNELADSSVVLNFALTKDGMYLYTAEPHYSLEYAYPQAGYTKGRLTPPPSGGNVIAGVAIVPPEIP
jgi:hypothetical protein